MSRMKTALIALTLALAAGAAQAQPPAVQTPTAPYSPPAFNSYLNLLNRNTNPAITYYGIIRPQVQQGQQLRMLQFGLTRTAEAEAATEQALTAAPGASATLPDTGHVAGFMTYPKYFNTVNPRGR